MNVAAVFLCFGVLCATLVQAYGSSYGAYSTPYSVSRYGSGSSRYGSSWNSGGYHSYGYHYGYGGGGGNGYSSRDSSSRSSSSSSKKSSSSSSSKKSSSSSSSSKKSSSSSDTVDPIGSCAADCTVGGHDLCLELCVDGEDCCPICTVQDTSDIHSLENDARSFEEIDVDAERVCSSCEAFFENVVCDLDADCSCDVSEGGICELCTEPFVCGPQGFCVPEPTGSGICADGYFGIDFEVDSNLQPLVATGEYAVTNQLPGVTVSAVARNGQARAALIFDTRNPGSGSSGDIDLGSPNENCPGGGPGRGAGGGPDNTFPNCTPLNNVLIIGEDCSPSEPAPGNPCRLDDEAGGGSLFFDFGTPRVVNEITVMDVENSNGVVAGFDAASNLLYSVPLQAAGDNSVQTVLLPTTAVSRLEVRVTTSAAVASLCVEEDVLDGDDDDTDPIDGELVRICLPNGEQTDVGSTSTCGCSADEPEVCSACRSSSGSAIDFSEPNTKKCRHVCGLNAQPAPRVCEPGDEECDFGTCPAGGDELYSCCNVQGELVCGLTTQLAAVCDESSSESDDDDDDDDDDDECAPCKNNVNYLVIRYTGAASNARVKITQKGKSGTSFNSRLDRDETFELHGRDRRGTFGKQLNFYVNNRYVGKLLTNCRLEIGPGTTVGNKFEIVAGTSRSGGALCPVRSTRGSGSRRDKSSRDDADSRGDAHDYYGYGSGSSRRNHHGGSRFGSSRSSNSRRRSFAAYGTGCAFVGTLAAGAYVLRRRRRALNQMNEAEAAAAARQNAAANAVEEQKQREAEIASGAVSAEGDLVVVTAAGDAVAFPDAANL